MYEAVDVTHHQRDPVCPVAVVLVLVARLLLAVYVVLLTPANTRAILKHMLNMPDNRATYDDESLRVCHLP